MFPSAMKSTRWRAPQFLWTSADELNRPLPRLLPSAASEADQRRDTGESAKGHHFARLAPTSLARCASRPARIIAPHHQNQAVDLPSCHYKTSRRSPAESAAGFCCEAVSSFPGGVRNHQRVEYLIVSDRFEPVGPLLQLTPCPAGMALGGNVRLPPAVARHRDDLRSLPVIRDGETFGQGRVVFFERAYGRFLGILCSSIYLLGET